MSDFARFLPLSNRERGGESDVSSDRHGLIADLVDDAARLIQEARPDDSAARNHLTTVFLDAAKISDPRTPDDAVTRLAAIAERIRSGPKRSIRHLVRAARAFLELSRTLERPATLAAATSGAVSLWAATSGPHERRVVLAGHTLRATDDGWEFGRGPVLEGCGVEIAAFGLGVSEIPPHPPAEVSSPR